jgi:hypothetical protein
MTDEQAFDFVGQVGVCIAGGIGLWFVSLCVRLIFQNLADRRDDIDRRIKR